MGGSSARTNPDALISCLTTTEGRPKASASVETSLPLCSRGSRATCTACPAFTTLVVSRCRATLLLAYACRGTSLERTSSTHGSQMRIFFHLVSASETIQDEEGVEVSRVEEAEAEAARIVREAQGNGAARRESAGWRLEARDGSGTLLFSFDLGGSG